MNIRQNPHILFLLAALFFFVWSFFEGDSLDLHLHDTYFVIAYQHVMWFFAVFFVFLFLIYRMLRKVLASNILSWIHVLMTLAFFIISFNPWNILGQSLVAAMPRRYYDYQSWQFGYAFPAQPIILLILLAGQLLLPVNIIWGVAKLMRKKE